MNNLKLIPNVCTKNSSNCFLSIPGGGVFDIDGNANVAINANAALQAAVFIPDTVSPTLDTFDLDMDTGLVTLHFSESMQYASLVRNFFELLNAVSTDGTHQLVLEP